MISSLRAAAAAELPLLASRLERVNLDPSRRDLHTFETPVAVLSSRLSELSGQGTLVALLEEQGGEVTGGVVLDVSPARERAWAWGPAILGEVAPLARAGALLDAALAALPPAVRRLSFYLDERNTLTASLLHARGAERRAPVHIYLAARPEAPPPAPAAELRSARASDCAALSALHDASFPSTYASTEELLARNPATARVLVADAPDGALAGYVAAMRQEDGTGYIDFVATAPASRGQGVAGRLLREALRWLFAELEVPAVFLTVAEDKLTARGLYERAGFRRHLTGIPYELLLRG